MITTITIEKDGVQRMECEFDESWSVTDRRRMMRSNLRLIGLIDTFEDGRLKKDVSTFDPPRWLVE
jgi:hypothetical protein